ncbi:hypothetical protein RRG08_021109 [Elysia crispata]|uniref:Uncharacterized protein n=1 Tax=Elysia crispata TaxID=231223 RepID=A0AAE0Z744_9GAST|nr:hypothetical protein RRG08_021109 [Elysia crispata]
MNRTLISSVHTASLHMQNRKVEADHRTRALKPTFRLSMYRHPLMRVSTPLTRIDFSFRLFASTTPQVPGGARVE